MGVNKMYGEQNEVGERSVPRTVSVHEVCFVRKKISFFFFRLGEDQVFITR